MFFTIQQQEEADALAARADRFDGFDRGDLDHTEDDCPVFTVLSDETLPNGYAMQVVSWSNGFVEVNVGGRMVASGFDMTVERANEIAQWWRTGCQS